MAVLDVIRMGHPVLREMAAPMTIEQINSSDTHQLINDMMDTLHATGGIGLAAPQVNHALQLAIIEISDESGRYGTIPAMPMSIYINPEIKILDETTQGFWEGCLSIPGLRGFVERPRHILVSFLDRTGEPGSLELEGFLATVFQHEFDHLKGRLYIDRMKDMTRLSFEEEYLQFQD